MTKKEILKLLEEVKNKNPFPISIFTEPKKRMWAKAYKALKKDGLEPEQLYGSWGRFFWNNCIENIKEDLKDRGVRIKCYVKYAKKKKQP